VDLRQCDESQVTAARWVYKQRQTKTLDNGHNAGKAKLAVVLLLHVLQWT